VILVGGVAVCLFTFAALRAVIFTIVWLSCFTSANGLTPHSSPIQRVVAVAYLNRAEQLARGDVLLLRTRGGVRSIVMSMFVRLFVRSHNSKTRRSNFSYLHMLPMAVAGSYSGGVAIRMYFRFCG